VLRPETVLARKQRKEMTFPEVLLWQRLRSRKAGVKFRNQHPIGPYVVDFYCSEHRLVIEVDGEVHNRGDRPAHDEKRDAFLRENGHQVMHVPAADILKDADGVAASIASLAANPLPHDAARRGPPPRAGEELP
jgi:very-short-patch-repair endonuclease